MAIQFNNGRTVVLLAKLTAPLPSSGLASPVADRTSALHVKLMTRQRNLKERQNPQSLDAALLTPLSRRRPLELRSAERSTFEATVVTQYPREFPELAAVPYSNVHDRSAARPRHGQQFI